MVQELRQNNIAGNVVMYTQLTQKFLLLIMVSGNGCFVGSDPIDNAALPDLPGAANAPLDTILPKDKKVETVDVSKPTYFGCHASMKLGSKEMLAKFNVPNLTPDVCVKICKDAVFTVAALEVLNVNPGYAMELRFCFSFRFKKKNSRKSNPCTIRLFQLFEQTTDPILIRFSGKLEYFVSNKNIPGIG